MILALALLGCTSGGSLDHLVAGTVLQDGRQVFVLDDTHVGVVGQAWSLVDLSTPTAPTATTDWDQDWWGAYDDGGVVWFHREGEIATASYADLIAGTPPQTVRTLDYSVQNVAASGSDLWVHDGHTVELWRDDAIAGSFELQQQVAHDMQIVGELLVIGTAHGTLVVDVSDPTAVVVLSALGRREMWRPDWDGDVLWVRMGGALGGTAWDMTDPTAPMWLGSVEANQVARPFGTHLLTERAVYDIADPTDPTVVTALPTPDGWRDAVRVGDWMVRVGERLEVLDIPW
jgi:hypothetical protein